MFLCVTLATQSTTSSLITQSTRVYEIQAEPDFSLLKSILYQLKVIKYVQKEWDMQIQRNFIISHVFLIRLIL